MELPVMHRRAFIGSGAAIAVGTAGVAIGLSGCAPTALSSFTTAQMGLIAAIAEAIIPTTDTPGAARAQVDRFIEKIVFQWLSDDERDDFVAGLRAFSQSAPGFSRQAPARQTDVLLAALTGGLPLIRRFVDHMKKLTIYGYYTSEVGAEQELELNIATGPYQPCSPTGEKAPSLSRNNPKLIY